MRPVSTSLLAAITGSHTMTARAVVVAAGQSGVNPTGTEIPLIDGDVVLDGTAQVRGSADLTTDGTSLWPASASDLLAPYGTEAFLQRGVDLGGGVVEWCSLGYFPIRTIDQKTPPDGPIRITAKDRMQGIVDARLLAPVQFSAGASLGYIMDTLVTEVYPSAVIDWDDATDLAVIARPLIAAEKRFEFLDDLVSSQGKIWYWDHRGHLIIKTAPDPGVPVFEVSSGEGGVLVSMTRQLSREGVYNAVVASGEGMDTQDPVRGVAFDSNPASPTYFSGPFGPVPKFYSSPFLATNDQATAAAVAELRRNLGLPYSVDFTAIPNPALEPWDPVAVRPASNVGFETHILESVTIPLVASAALSASTRNQTVVLIGTG